MDKADLAVRGAANAPIQAEQVRRLILVASSAHKVQLSLGLTEDGFDRWRKGVLWDLCGKASFRALGQREFGRALGEFQRLGGKDSPAAAARPQGAWGRKNAEIAKNETGPEGDRRRAEFKLRQECANVADAFGGEAQALAYSLVLLRQIHGLPQGRELAAATARQLFATLFTLRNRAARRLRKIMLAAVKD